MRFRLHSIVALVGAMLLLPVAGRTQDSSAPAAQQPATQQPAEKPPAAPAGQEAAPESMPQAPIQPVMGGAYPVMSKEVEARGRQIFEMFNHSDTGQMWASLSEGLRKQSGKEDRFATINKKMRERFGPETEMLEETIVPYILAPDTTYSRLSRFQNVRLPVMTIITINQRGQIDAFDFKFMPEIAEGRYAGYEDTAKLRLPFNGEWLVYQGGRNMYESGYAVEDDQRYGIDFAYLKNGRLFSGPGGLASKLEDYYCYGQPILAPADGTVIKAEAYYDDNLPGKSTGDSPDGNVIVISHGNSESSMFTHLKQNSLKFKHGDTVKQGDVIAECGNSGAGTVPHIHFQFQRTAGQPLPAQFVDYISNGKPVASGEPKRGEFVKNGAPTAASSTDKAMPTQNPSH
jgi:hypothetical protein